EGGGQGGVVAAQVDSFKRCRLTAGCAPECGERLRRSQGMISRHRASVAHAWGVRSAVIGPDVIPTGAIVHRTIAQSPDPGQQTPRRPELVEGRAGGTVRGRRGSTGLTTRIEALGPGYFASRNSGMTGAVLNHWLSARCAPLSSGRPAHDRRGRPAAAR